jgi:Protein of unknown function (DUF2550)
MPWWEDLLDLVGLLVLVSAVLFAFLFVRRRFLSRKGGTFECSLRRRVPTRRLSSGARGWQLGLGRYDGENLQWFRVFSFSPRPKAVFSRPIDVVSQRVPHGAEAFSLYAGHVILLVRPAHGAPIEMAMSEGAVTALLAWAEAAPPGHDRLLG